MRILLLSRSSNAGGGTTWCETLTNGLSERKHTVRVIFTRLGDPSNFMHKRLGSHLVESLCYQYPKPEWPAMLGGYIDSFQPTHILVDNQERMREVATRSAWLSSGAAKVVFICHCHGVPFSQLEELRPWLHKVICVSEASAGLLKDYDPVVIRNAVNPPPEEGTDIRVRLGIPHEAFVVGYVGRHDTNKNTGALYGILQDTDWWLLLGGKNAPKPPAEMASTLKDRVRVQDGEIEGIGDWLRAMDVFVLPSKSEGFPLSPLEALLCGCRVVMTPTSDYPTLFADAIAFFDYGDVEGMGEAIASAPDPAIGQEIIREQLSVKRMLTQYEEALLR